MKLIVRLRSGFGTGSMRKSVSAFFSFFPSDSDVSHGDLISERSLLRGSSTTLLQSKAILSLTGFSGASSMILSEGRSKASGPNSGSLKSILATVLISRSAGISTLLPQKLQNLAPSASLFPQLLQNTMLPPIFVCPGDRPFSSYTSLHFFAHQKQWFPQLFSEILLYFAAKFNDLQYNMKGL